MPNITDAVRQSVSDDAKNQALKWVGQAILASAGAGIGARGLLGLYNLHRNPIKPTPVPLSGVLPIEVPVPEEEPSKKTAGLLFTKAAMGGVPAGAGRAPTPVTPQPVPGNWRRGLVDSWAPMMRRLTGGGQSASPMAAPATPTRNVGLPAGLQPFQAAANTARRGLGLSVLGGNGLSAPAPSQVASARPVQRPAAPSLAAARPAPPRAAAPSPRPTVLDPGLTGTRSPMSPAPTPATAPAVNIANPSAVLARRPAAGPQFAVSPASLTKTVPSAISPQAVVAKPQGGYDPMAALNAASAKLHPAGSTASVASGQSDFFGRPAAQPRDPRLQARIDKYNQGYEAYLKDYNAYANHMRQSGARPEDIHPMIPRVSAEGINSHEGWDAAMGRYNQDAQKYDQDTVAHNQKWNLNNQGGPTVSQLAKQRYGMTPAIGMLSKRSNALKFLAGDMATQPHGVPWALPATVFGGALGAAGGWKLVDYLLDKRRRAEIDQDVQKAQTEFQSALQSSYGPGEKKAETDSLGADLDALYDQFQKTANLADTAGLTAGVIGTGMGSLGMLAALMSYQEASKRRKSVILNKAMNSWQRRMWRDQPPAVAVQPLRKPAPAIVPTQTDEDTEQS